MVSFSPASPAGGELMALIRGFGSPLHMLVQPTAVSSVISFFIVLSLLL